MEARDEIAVGVPARANSQSMSMKQPGWKIHFFFATALGMIVVWLALFLFTPLGQKLKELGKPGRTSTAPAQPLPPPEPPQVIEAPRPPRGALSSDPLVYSEKLESRLYNGIRLEATIASAPGGSGIEEATLPYAERLLYSLKVKVPRASHTQEELARLNPELPKALPALETMLQKAVVSPYFKSLYKNKTKRLEKRAGRLDQLLSRHNFYDCETILEMSGPTTGRKFLLIQAEMDTLTDGSDGDRLASIAGESPSFQPFTSYSWAKRGKTPNPFLAKKQSEFNTLRKEFQAGASAERKQVIKERLKRLKVEVRELKTRSYLVGGIDPFIALPIFMIRDEFRAYGPNIGDYAIVIHQGKLYPAIVGDSGPNFKIGEASHLIAKAINPKTTIWSRPVSDLAVTYLVFPKTASKPFGAPDYDRIRAKCQKLLNEIGGSPVRLHSWTKTPKPEESQELEEVEPPSAASAEAKGESASAGPEEKSPEKDAAAAPDSPMEGDEAQPAVPGAKLNPDLDD